jgi:hypothetical protein
LIDWLQLVCAGFASQLRPAVLWRQAQIAAHAGQDCFPLLLLGQGLAERLIKKLCHWCSDLGSIFLLNFAYLITMNDGVGRQSVHFNAASL